ncbi:MAG: metal ABC transporter permease, partial [Phycisphaerales bacterium]|nr:metal ABC transporter permease [Phycisphaerales bacterium]
AIVTIMRLAGVLLATALLVLPGATGLRLSDRLSGVMAWSLAAGVVGVMGGLVLSFEADLSPGPSIVLALVGVYVVACGVGLVAGRGASR